MGSVLREIRVNPDFYQTHLVDSDHFLGQLEIAEHLKQMLEPH
jgi:hypothetical protein